jgi:hypothetical protein
VISFTLQPLYSQGKSPRYPLDRRLGDPRSGLDGVERRKILSLPRLEFDPSAVQPVASRFTDCSIPAPALYMHIPKLLEHNLGRVTRYPDCGISSSSQPSRTIMRKMSK